MDNVTTWALLVAVAVWIAPLAAQVRGGRRTATVKGEEGKAAAAGPRGVAVKGEEGYAAAGRHGAVAKGDEGYAAVGRHGAVASGEDGYARAGPRGAVVAGEEGYSAVGRGGVVVGHNYESYEAWRAVAGVGAAIAIGTMLAKPPAASTTVVVSGSSYYYSEGTVLHARYFGRVDRLSGRRAPSWRHHHDAAGRLQIGASSQRHLQSMWLESITSA